MNKNNHFQFTANSANKGIALLNANMSDFSYDRHAHEEYALGVTLKGRQDFFCRRSFYKSSAGGVLLFNPEDIHDGHSGGDENLHYRMLYIHPEKLHPLFLSLGYNNKSPVRVDGAVHHDTALRRQVLAMSELIDQQNIGSSLEQEAILLQIAHSLLTMAGDVKANNTTRRVDTLLLRGKEFIHANLDKDISLDEICDEVNISKYHFIRMFRS